MGGSHDFEEIHCGRREATVPFWCVGQGEDPPFCRPPMAECRAVSAADVIRRSLQRPGESLKLWGEPDEVRADARSAIAARGVNAFSDCAPCCAAPTSTSGARTASKGDLCPSRRSLTARFALAGSSQSVEPIHD